MKMKSNRIADNLVIGTKKDSMDNERYIVLVDINVREEEGKYTLSISGDELAPFKLTREKLMDKIEDYIDDMRYSEPKVLLDLLEEHDCRWSDLPEELEDSIELGELFDLHQCGYGISLGSEEGFCEHYGEGQIGLEDVDFIDPQFGKFLDMLWKGFHLQEVPLELVNYLEEWLKNYWDIVGDTDVWVEDWMVRNQHNI